MVFLLYDDDCGICTKFSKFLKRLLKNRVLMIPMHMSNVERKGIEMIGDDYWKSFHVVSNKKWSTEGLAILALSRIFPLGKILAKVVENPFVNRFLVFILRRMQFKRNIECKAIIS